MKKHNFGAGPCILPQSVFEEASKAILELDNSGLSVLEISHRSAAFIKIMEEARDLALELTELKNKGYHALFLQGGASTQFLMTPYNLLKQKAGYLNTGRWSEKAMKEAQLFGATVEIASSEDKNFSYIPKDYEVPGDLDYLHITTNNTVAGTQIKDIPDTDVPLVCDMSSDILSRTIDYSQFDLIYAGAQKNLGPAGTTLVLVKEDILGNVDRTIPSMLDYQIHIDKDSIYNTPSVYAIYCTLLNLRQLKKNGGIKTAAQKNQEKANLLYGEIDRNSAFEGIVAKEDRSQMNVTFKLKDETHKEEFNQLWQEAGIIGLNGHRSVGGYRASLYNALPLKSVEKLVSLMKFFEQ